MKFRRTTLFYSILVSLLFVTCKKENNDENGETEEPVVGTFIDFRDNIEYKTVTIGQQVWMAENLRFLPEVMNPVSGSYSEPFYYVYGYTGTNVEEAKATDNYNTYGVLYNWAAAMGQSSRNPNSEHDICPAGWHLPDDLEWHALHEHLGGNEIAGGKLKETGTSHWNSPNHNATNSSGFSALPGGGRGSNGAFGYLGFNGYWWSAYGISDKAWYRSLSHNSNIITSLGDRKDLGFSVRCVKNNQ